MFKSLGNLLINLLPKGNSFQLSWKFDHAMDMAQTTPDSDDRLNWCNEAFQIAEKLDPWPFPNYPRDFALGILYSVRGQTFFELRSRDYVTFSRLAVTDLETGARLLTPADGARWSYLMNVLSVAYAESPDGIPADNKERAIEVAEFALTAIDQSQETELWAEITGSLGGFYFEREKGNRKENREKAFSLLEEAYTVAGANRESRVWCMTSVNLSNAYRERNGHEGEDIETAINLIESALPIIFKVSFPEEAAGSLISLSSCYEARQKGDSSQNAKRAIEIIDSALDILTRETTPIEWATAQMQRGTLFVRLGGGDSESNTETAIRSYEAALTVFTQEIFPAQHAQVMLNLAQARGNLKKGSKRAHMEDAVEAARAALAVVSKDSSPQVWAMASAVLGNALRVRREGDRRQDMEDSIAAFEDALSVVNRESDPETWSFIKSSLADALAERIAGDELENMELSVKHLQESLEVLDPNADPVKWAGTLHHLSVSFKDRSVGSRADNTEHAIALAELALVVLNPYEHRKQYSRLFEDLGQAFEERIRGNLIENSKQALEAYDAAWDTRTREEDVEAWLRLRQRRLKVAITLKDNRASSTESSAPPEEQEKPTPESFLQDMEDAASAVTPEDHPHTWTLAQEGLADAYIRTAASGTPDLETLMVRHKDRVLKAIGIYEKMLPVYPKELNPRRWARTRSLMASAYALLHLLEDFQHRGVEGLPDRARPELPNRSDKAMKYLDLAAEAMTDVLSVYKIEFSAHEHLRNAIRLGSHHIERRDWETAAATFVSAGIAADKLLADIEASESEIQDTLQILGELSTLGPFVEIMRGRPEQSLRLLEVGRGRLLAKALHLSSLPLPEPERAEVNELLQLISLCERRLITPNLIDRATPLNKVIDLRRRFREILSGLDSSVISPLVDAQQLLTEITSEGAGVVVPLLTAAGGYILFGSAVGDKTNLETVETDSIVELEGIFKSRISEGLSSWLEAYNRFNNVNLAARGMKLDSPDNDVEKTPGTSFPADSERNIDEWNQILKETGKSLGALIAEPLLRKLDDTKFQGIRLDILPQGALGLLPVNLARLPHSDSALIDRFELSFSPSLTVLSHVRRRNILSETPQTIAVIRHSDGAGASLLRNTQVETDLVTSWFDKSNRFVLDGRDKDSMSNVLEVLREKDVWHFACHGKLDSNVPLNSGLGPLNGDFLELRDLFNARGLGAPQLVILSACNTGFYDVNKLPGEFIGFPNAFLQLGADAVVATLWKVMDITTALLMGRFYEEYFANQKPSCSALRAAQLWLRDAQTDELRRVVGKWTKEGRMGEENAIRIEQDLLYKWGESKTPPFAQPSYWAGFVHFGK